MNRRIILSGLMACFLVSSVSGICLAKGPKNKTKDIPPGQAKADGERAIGKGLIKNNKFVAQVETAEQEQAAVRETGPAEKATGGVGYEAAGLFREIEFNAHEQNGDCQVQWQVGGNWVLSLGDNATDGITSDNDTHGMTISGQDGSGNLAGSGGYPAGMPYSQGWTLANSYVSSDNIHLEMDYNATDYTVILDGGIDGNGTMSGEWLSSSYQSGNWTSVSGEASQLAANCEGKGMLYYNDEDGNWYDVEVQYVNVVGNTAWFAGPVISASSSAWTSNWVFCKVVDNGEPASGVDQVAGSFTTMEEAKIGVATMQDPSVGFFTVEMGNLQVHAR